MKRTAALEEKRLQREEIASRAKAELIWRLKQPPSFMAQMATAQELMDTMEIGEFEARELFPEKFVESGSDAKKLPARRTGLGVKD